MVLSLPPRLAGRRRRHRECAGSVPGRGTKQGHSRLRALPRRAATPRRNPGAHGRASAERRWLPGSRDLARAGHRGMTGEDREQHPAATRGGEVPPDSAHRCAMSSSWPLPAAGSPRRDSQAAAVSAGTPASVSVRAAYSRSVTASRLDAARSARRSRTGSPVAASSWGTSAPSEPTASASARDPTARPDLTQAMP